MTSPKASASGSRCAACPHAYECGKLYSALEVMNSMAEEGNAVLKAMRRSFLFKLGMYGYDYLSQNHRCSAALKRDTIRSLTSEAIEVLNGMTLRSRIDRHPEAKPKDLERPVKILRSAQNDNATIAELELERRGG